MNSILSFAKIAYIKSQNIKPLLGSYTNPDDFISRLVKSGELIRIKNGFFVIAEKIKENPVPYEQIANLLYGPSYVSLEWALSYYKMIPEGVYVMTSVCVDRSKSFKTPIGTFDYNYLNHSRYSIGIDQKENVNGRFLIARPEKSLADLVHFKSRKMNKNDLLIDLIESRRIEEGVLKKLDKKLMIEIADCYQSKAVSNLSNVLGML